MKRNLVVCAALVLSPTLTVRAQHVPVSLLEIQGQRGSMGIDQHRLLYDFLLLRPIEAQVVKGAPYSAEVVTESVQVLQDGNRIVHRTSGRVYRDSIGRVRREEDQPSGPPMVTISDPVAGKTFTLNASTRRARETRALGALDLSLYNAQARDAYLGLSQGYRFAYRKPLADRLTQGGDDVVNEEKLADRSIEGVVATGVRRTTTIAAGAIGNEKPIRIVSEEWRSSELQVLVLTDLNDPRSGRSTYKLLKINRAEPDPALFKVPGDYTVERGGL
jgi:hypothetical protein